MNAHSFPRGPIVLYYDDGRRQRIADCEPWALGFRRRFADPQAHQPSLRLLKLLIGYAPACEWLDGFSTAACLQDDQLCGLPGLPVAVTVECTGGEP